MFTIAKRFSFDASHQLVGLEEGHKCARLHGHTYTVEVQLEATSPDATGMVFDYGRLKPVKDWLAQFADHRHLNDMDWLEGLNPTAEFIAYQLLYIFDGMLEEGLPTGVRLSAVRVAETPNTWAEYRTVTP